MDAELLVSSAFCAFLARRSFDSRKGQQELDKFFAQSMALEWMGVKAELVRRVVKITQPEFFL